MEVTTESPIVGDTFEEKEKDLLKREALIMFDLESFNEEQAETFNKVLLGSLEDFIIHCFLLFGLIPTVYVQNPSTKQCDPERNRSLVDIFLLCKHYHPDCTLEEVRNLLIKQGPVGHICPTIDRRIYNLPSRVPYWRVYHSTEFDEFGLNFRKEIEEGRIPTELIRN